LSTVSNKVLRVLAQVVLELFYKYRILAVTTLATYEPI
jgi:hypothetical protein